MCVSHQHNEYLRPDSQRQRGVTGFSSDAHVDGRLCNAFLFFLGGMKNKGETLSAKKCLSAQVALLLL